MAGGCACIAHHVGDTQAVESISEQGDARQPGGEARFQFRHALEVANSVLREAGGKPADNGDEWIGQGPRGGTGEGSCRVGVSVEDSGELEAGDGGDFIVVAG